MQKNGTVMMVSQHFSRKENEVTVKGDGLTPIARNMKKTYDSNIYIKNVPITLTEEEFKKEFASCGNIISCKLNDTPQPSNYRSAYVLYDNVQDAQRAIKNYHESSVFGGKPLQVDFWLSKQEIASEKK